MRCALIAFTMITVTFGAYSQGAKGEAEKLQGKWNVTAMERNGKAAPKAMTDNLLVAFAGDKMTLTRVNTGKGTEYSFKVDPSKKPKTIDLTALEGKVKG